MFYKAINALFSPPLPPYTSRAAATNAFYIHSVLSVHASSSLQYSFSFMDRGVVFKIVARYLEAFSVKENIVSLSKCVLTL